mgnify:CR=1 FL=1
MICGRLYFAGLFSYAFIYSEESWFLFPDNWHRIDLRVTTSLNVLIQSWVNVNLQFPTQQVLMSIFSIPGRYTCLKCLNLGSSWIDWVHAVLFKLLFTIIVNYINVVIAIERDPTLINIFERSNVETPTLIYESQLQSA